VDVHEFGKHVEQALKIKFPHVPDKMRIPVFIPVNGVYSNLKLAHLIYFEAKVCGARAAFDDDVVVQIRTLSWIWKNVSARLRLAQ